jgi:outer membrane lipoprotein-sorting protein
LLLGSSGCTPTLYKEPIDLESVPARDWSREEMLRRLGERADRLGSLRSLASVHYQGKDGKGKVQEAIVIQRPDRLRLETLSSFGVVLVVTANGERVAGFDPRENLFVHGKSSRENLLRLTRIPLGLREITGLLLGLPPVPIQENWEAKENTLRRALSAGGSETVAFHPKLGLPVQWERSHADGETELSASFSDFTSTPEGPFPLKISLEAPGQHKRIEIRYQEPELNVTLPPQLFVQEKPQNARELPIESVGG